MKLRHQLAVFSPITPAAESHAVAAALRLTADPRRELLDLLLREYDAQHGLLCGSGTQALQLAIMMGMHETGATGAGAVALPAFSCFDVASAAVGAGAPIALYDIDPDTLGPSLESLGRVLADGVRVAVIAPLYGVPVDWEALDALAAAHGALLIEDAAQGHGASWRGKRLGSLGRISTLSFGRGKGWTGGSGGAVLLRRGAGAATSLLPSAGMRSEVASVAGSMAQWLLGRPSIYGIPRSIPALGLGVTTYRAPSAPVSISRAAAAAVLANRNASEREAAVRRGNAQGLLAALMTDEAVRAARIPDDGEAGYLRLPVRVAYGRSVPALWERLSRLGVERSYPCTLAELPEAAAMSAGPERAWRGAATLAAQLLTVPTHSRMRIAERGAIAEILRRGPSR